MENCRNDHSNCFQLAFSERSSSVVSSQLVLQNNQVTNHNEKQLNSSQEKSEKKVAKFFDKNLKAGGEEESKLEDFALQKKKTKKVKRNCFNILQFWYTDALHSCVLLSSNLAKLRRFGDFRTPSPLCHAKTHSVTKVATPLPPTCVTSFFTGLFHEL